MFVVTPVLTLVLILRRFFQVEFESVKIADGVEAIPRLAEGEAEFLVVSDRALEVIDKKLWREGRDARRSRW